MSTIITCFSGVTFDGQTKSIVNNIKLGLIDAQVNTAPNAVEFGGNEYQPGIRFQIKTLKMFEGAMAGSGKGVIDYTSGIDANFMIKPVNMVGGFVKIYGNSPTEDINMLVKASAYNVQMNTACTIEVLGTKAKATVVINKHYFLARFSLNMVFFYLNWEVKANLIHVNGAVSFPKDFTLSATVNGGIAKWIKEEVGSFVKRRLEDFQRAKRNADAAYNKMKSDNANRVRQLQNSINAARNKLNSGKADVIRALHNARNKLTRTRNDLNHYNKELRTRQSRARENCWKRSTLSCPRGWRGPTWAGNYKCYYDHRDTRRCDRHYRLHFTQRCYRNIRSTRRLTCRNRYIHRRCRRTRNHWHKSCRRHRCCWGRSWTTCWGSWHGHSKLYSPSISFQFRIRYN